MPLVHSSEEHKNPLFRGFRRFVAQGNQTLLSLSNDQSTNLVGKGVWLDDGGSGRVIQIQSEIKLDVLE
jgi:hypothetical protein